jgi:phosphatidylserine/phosphatidylglycerophosphate/cardiolipin synthase-like enzyme
VELIVQPGDGAKPLVEAASAAQKSLELIIFRFDLKPLEKAIESAVGRGVAVRALIAHTNSGGEKRLRSLEQRLLASGATVSRTGDDLVRYHGKLMIVDRQELHVCGFNYTTLDLKSRSFALVSRDRRTVQDAVRLFEADAQRQPFEPSDALIVSPENAREQLADFIAGAKRQLLIWDPKVTDPQMVRLLQQRVKSGVDVRIIGKVAKRGTDLLVQKSPIRLHVRAMVRDGTAAFVGSQSLRALELDGRREVGLVAKDAKVVKGMTETFEADWAKTDAGKKAMKEPDEEAELAVS